MWVRPSRIVIEASATASISAVNAKVKFPGFRVLATSQFSRRCGFPFWFCRVFSAAAMQWARLRGHVRERGLCNLGPLLPGGQAEIGQVGVNRAGVIDMRMPAGQGNVRRLAGTARGHVKSGLIRRRSAKCRPSAVDLNTVSAASGRRGFGAWPHPRTKLRNYLGTTWRMVCRSGLAAGHVQPSSSGARVAIIAASASADRGRSGLRT